SVTVSISLQSYRIALTPGIAGLEPGAPANFVGNSAYSIYSKLLTPANLTQQGRPLWTPFESVRVSGSRRFSSGSSRRPFLSRRLSWGPSFCVKSAFRRRREPCPPQDLSWPAFLQ